MKYLKLFEDENYLMSKYINDIEDIFTLYIEDYFPKINFIKTTGYGNSTGHIDDRNIEDPTYYIRLGYNGNVILTINRKNKIPKTQFNKQMIVLKKRLQNFGFRVSGRVIPYYLRRSDSGPNDYYEVTVSWSYKVN